MAKEACRQTLGGFRLNFDGSSPELLYALLAGEEVGTVFPAKGRRK